MSDKNYIHAIDCDMGEDCSCRRPLEVRTRTAQDVVGEVVDFFAEQHIPLAGRFRGIIGRHAKDLLDSGFDFETVVVASVIAVRRGAPQNLTFIAADLVTARAGQRMTRIEYERALQDEMEVKAREARR